jgi:hypothetical protein
LPLSATSSEPSDAMATSRGLLSAAAEASPPSPENPGVVPAIVVTTPLGVTRRMRALFVSAMYIVPSPATATPPGWLRRAPVARPPSPPAPGRPSAAPATRLIVPLGATRWMQLTFTSAIR